MARVAALLVSIAAAGCAATAPADEPPVICAGNPAPCVDVHIVAHEDDDLLFINPDLAAGVAAGNHVWTIYVTAGTRTDPPYMAARETGILNAYAYMIDPGYAVTDRADAAAMLAHWRLHGDAPIAIGDAGKRAIRYDFAEPRSGGSVSVVFLRLFEIGGTDDISALWRGTTASVSTVACRDGCGRGSTLEAQAYDREQLIDVLDALLAGAEEPGVPLVASTLDATQLFHRREDYGLGWVDNADHIAAAEFAVAAFVRHHRHPSALEPQLVQYRGYDTGQEPTNVASTAEDKARTFYRYYAVGEALTSDDNGQSIEWTNRDPDHPVFRNGPYDEWTKRRYAVFSTPAGEGPLVVGEARCLLDTGALGPCDGAPAWTLTPQHELHPVAAPARCLVVGAADAAVTVAPCLTRGDADRQTWILTDTGQLRGRDATCLHGDDSGLRALPCGKQVDRNGDPVRRPLAAEQWSWGS